ncbi:unnamed protein product [Alopecurus aequalis]
MSVPLPADRSPLRVEGRPTTPVRSCSAPSSETAAQRLTDDILLEILPRVPAKSLCRCRCVSKHWRSLIDHRKKLPPTLAGFFYTTTSTNSVPEETVRQPPVLLATVPGSLRPLVSTSLAFLPTHQRLDLLDCCSGLLLCRWYGVSTQIAELPYLVCNPATEKWVALPASIHGYHVTTTRLGFDPAHSSHFHVFELFYDQRCLSPDYRGCTGVAVYSSDTGGWVHNKFKRQPSDLPRCYSQETVFLNSRLHFHVTGYDGFYPTKGLAAVDTQAETWTSIGVPGNAILDSFIQCSRGRLHYIMFCKNEEGRARLRVYVLDNYESQGWTPKHDASASYILIETDDTDLLDFRWVGVHPDRNLIFFTTGQGQATTLLCYEMDFEQVKVICNVKDAKPPYLPYVPLYAELESLHM